MDFELSADQVALQEAARDLLDDRAGHDQVRAPLQSGRPFDEGLWKALADQGWLGIALAEAQGGIGLGWVEAAVLLEQVGRHTAPVPFLPSLLALTVLAGADQPPASWVDDLVSGDNVFFAATGITSGELLEGVRFLGEDRCHTQSLVMRSYSGTARYIDAEHNLAKLRRRRDPVELASKGELRLSSEG